MKFGFQQPSHDGTNPFEQLKKVAQLSESEGFDSFWIMDHLIQIEYAGKKEDPILEAYTTLAALAASTTGIKLGALCTCNFFRNPALLAKMAATLDIISKRRFWLGVGAGWYREEAQMFGYDFPDFAMRVEMLEESLKIIKGAFSKTNFNFKGKHYQVENLVVRPRSRSCPPILIGGGSRQVLRLVAKYGDACNLFPKGEELGHKLDVLKKECKLANREYSSVLKTKLSTAMFGRDRPHALQRLSMYKPKHVPLDDYVQSAILGSPRQMIEEIEEYERLGIDYLIINFRGKYDPGSLKMFSRQVMRSF